ncbi:MAG: 16S rRNA (uracil(1498)-N(3))-methyltransferase [Spirochaetales bacterium]|nr:16S rRNA (uracil(1498)-N(3))-methyltransferase [Candidatus Physcosoma equi]
MRVFLLDKSYDGSPFYALRARERSYLEKVLRLEEGTTFTAKDREEHYYKAIILGDGTLSLEPTDNPEDTFLDNLSGYSGPFAPITIFVSILKGKKNESVVRALTEIGVKRIVFVQTEFVQEKDFSAHQRERLEVILKEAVQQCGGKTPSLEGPVSFEEALEMADGTSILLHQSTLGSTKCLSDVFKDYTNLKKEIFCFIGPEGGFSDKECEKAEEMGIIPVLLNTNILRAETASVYTAAAIQALVQN